MLPLIFIFYFLYECISFILGYLLYARIDCDIIHAWSNLFSRFHIIFTEITFNPLMSGGNKKVTHT